MRVAQHFKLDQLVAVQQFARQTQGTYGVVCRVAACGVRQVGELFWRYEIQQRRLAGILTDVGATNGDGHDFAAAGVKRRACLLEILVFARADQQAGTVCLAGDVQCIHVFLLPFLTAADGADDLQLVAGV